MTTGNDDQWLDDLLSKLPKGEPVTELELKKYEHRIAEFTASLPESPAQKLFSRNIFRVPIGIAAAIVVLVVGFSLNNGESIVKTDAPVALDSPSQNSPSESSPTPSETPSAGDNSSPAPSAAPSKTSTPKPSATVPEQTVSQGNDGSKVAVREYSTNLDYDQDLQALRAKITLRKTPGSLRGLSGAKQSCATKQGLASQLVAVDNAMYQGRPITAYFSVDNSGAISVLITSVSCEEITTIDWA
jgi:hypothetical protein